MSRIAKNPVPIPQGVEVTISATQLHAKGLLGERSMRIVTGISLEQNAQTIVVHTHSQAKKVRAMAGTTRMLAANLVMGVSHGFQKTLELRGVGYRCQVQGSTITLALGYSNPRVFTLPAEITATTSSQTVLTIKGNDKQLVGQVAAEIRRMRPPEPYKGKGVRYLGEVVRIKEVKKKK